MRLPLIRAGSVTILAAVVLLSGCGGNGDDGAGGDNANGGGTEDLAAFQAKVEEDTENATSRDPARPPTEGPKAASDKSVFVIGCSFQAEGCARPTKAAAEAARAIGWRTTLIDTQGDPAKAGNSIQQAISRKADGIVVNGFDGPALKAPLAAARDAGLKLVGMVAHDPEGSFDSVIPETLEPDGYLIGQQAYEMSNGNLKMLMFTGDEFGVVRQRVNGTERFIEDCKAAGGQCEIVGKQDLIAAQLGTQAPGQAAALARANPNFTVVYTPYDAAGPFIIQGLRQSGVNLGESFMVGFDANAPNLEMIREDGYQKATIGLTLEWMGYQGVDNLNRMFAGEKPLDLGTKHKLLTKDNVPATGAWEGDFPGYREAFKQLWGK